MKFRTDHNNKKGKRSRGGFTLAEVLIAILLMVMVSGLLVRGVSLATDSYTEVTDTANAQMLLSTTMTLMRHELTTATEVEIDGRSLSYRNGSRGSDSALTSDEEGIKLTEYVKPGQTGRLLVSPEAATKGLTASYEEAVLENGVLSFTGLKVEKDGKVLASQEVFEIRLGSEGEVEE